MQTFRSHVSHVLGLSLLLGLICGLVGSPARADVDVYAHLATGGHHACGVLVSGEVKCWGYNNEGELGRDAKIAASASPLLVPNLSDARFLALGAWHSCALLVSREVKCWGANNFGQLGIGVINTSVSSPTLISGLSDVQTLAMGYTHSCALLMSRQVKCWGSNDSGQLGLGYISDSVSSPTLIPDLTDVRTLVVGYDQSCVFLVSRVVKCWGYNQTGQLGLGYVSDSVSSPTTVSGLEGAQSLAMGSAHACAVLKSGKVDCWGGNELGQLGLGFASESVLSPMRIPNLADVQTLASGSFHSCAALKSGKVKCWGNNSEGELGLGYSHLDSPSGNYWNSSPTIVPDLDNVHQIHEGLFFSCAELESRTVSCWGYNMFGQLGLNYTSSSVTKQVQVPGLVMRPLLAAPTNLVASSIESTRFVIGFKEPLNPNSEDLISEYQYSLDGGSNWISPNVALGVSPLLVSGLRRTTAYSVSIRAVYSDGPGRSSDPISVTTSATPASAPVITKVSGGNQLATINFTSPSDNGGANITNYEVSTDDGASWAATFPARTTSPLIVRGLRNGDTYALKIRAVNLVGAGVASNAVSVAPRTTPSAPTISSVTSSSIQTMVYFSSPVTDGGVDISNYEYAVDGEAWVACDPNQTGSPLTISGLIGGQTYSIQLRAVNSVGSGTPSKAVKVMPPTTATAPAITAIIGGDQQATINYVAPASNGGAVIENYEYSLDGGSTWRNAAPAQITSPLVISGLSNGTTYSVRLRAVNAVGSGLASNTVLLTPMTIPSAPLISGITNGNRQATVSFGIPTNDGGSRVTNYQYSTDGGSTWNTPTPARTVSPIVITGLSNGQNYSIKLRAVNSAGQGAASAPMSVMPGLLPQAPIEVIAEKATPTSLSLAWATPDDGGLPITGYKVRVSKDGGKTWSDSTDTSSRLTTYLLSNLEPDTAYWVQVAAFNLKGVSGWPPKSSLINTPPKQSQVITFPQPRPLRIGNGDRALAARTSAEGFQVMFSVAPASRSICTIVGKKLHAKKVGLCRVIASQSGDANYRQAPDISRVVTIKK